MATDPNAFHVAMTEAMRTQFGEMTLQIISLTTRLQFSAAQQQIAEDRAVAAEARAATAEAKLAEQPAPEAVP